MPFAGYKNFADCAAKNASKKDPQAYCSVIMRAAEGIQVWEREFSSSRRDKLSGKGYALPDGSFPIVTAGDLGNAIKAIGRAKDPAAAKRHIIKRAKALGKTSMLPEGWSSSTKAKEEILPMKPPTTDRVLIDAQEAEFNTDAEGKMTARLQIIKSGRPIGKKRDYTEGALQKAATEGIYNGIRMFVDHSDKPPTSRKMKEMVSAVESTEWDPQRKAVMGTVEFFDKEFFDYTQRAKKHMGVSADHVIGVTYVQEGRDRIERVTSIPQARSVDWVVYPAAGGEILSFAREAEGEDQVEWNEVTLDQLKEHAPELLEAYKTELSAKESEEDDPDDGPPVAVSRDEIARMVQEGVQEALTKSEKRADNIRESTKKVREFVAKSGLPGRTQARIVNSFADTESYDEVAVKEAVDEAKEELKEAGARGPRITGMGPSGDSGEAAPATGLQVVRESVEAVFGVKKAEEKK